jgi:MFS family permease
MTSVSPVSSSQAPRQGDSGARRASQPRQGAFASLSLRNFRLFWLGQIISVSGTFMQSTAQQWLVLTLAPGNPMALGITGALQFGPILVLGPAAGILIDRYPRRSILFATQTIAGLQALAMWVLTATGVIQLWHVYALALLLGIVTAMDTPTRQAFVSEMAPPNFLLNAISLNSVQFNVARIVGPAVAGGLIAALGIPLLFLLNAVSFIAVIAGLAMMRVGELFPVPRLKGGRGSGLRGINEGMRFIWTNRDVRIVFFLLAVVGLLGFNFNVLLPLQATNILHAGAAEFGLLSSALGAGALVGALTLARRSGKPTHAILIGTALVFGLMEALAGRMGTLIPAMVFIAATGAMMSSFSAAANTTVQLSTAPEMRGRVMSVYMMIFMGSTPFGNLAVSGIAASFGAPASFLFSGLPCVAAALVAAALWRRERVRSAELARVAAPLPVDTTMRLTAETRLGTGVAPDTTDVGMTATQPATQGAE